MSAVFAIGCVWFATGLYDHVVFDHQAMALEIVPDKRVVCAMYMLSSLSFCASYLIVRDTKLLKSSKLFLPIVSLGVSISVCAFWLYVLVKAEALVFVWLWLPLTPVFWSCACIHFAQDMSKIDGDIDGLHELKYNLKKA
jgi:hypothetical protein